MKQIPYTKPVGVLDRRELALLNAGEYFERTLGEFPEAIDITAIPYNALYMNQSLQDGCCLVFASQTFTVAITGCRWTDDEWWFECVNPGEPYDTDIAWVPLSALPDSSGVSCCAVRPKLV